MAVKHATSLAASRGRRLSVPVLSVQVLSVPVLSPNPLSLIVICAQCSFGSAGGTNTTVAHCAHPARSHCAEPGKFATRPVAPKPELRTEAVECGFSGARAPGCWNSLKDRSKMLETARRLLVLSARSEVPPFIVMDVMAAAGRIEAAGGHVIHMEVGQPAAPAPS